MACCASLAAALLRCAAFWSRFASVASSTSGREEGGSERTRDRQRSKERAEREGRRGLAHFSSRGRAGSWMPRPSSGWWVLSGWKNGAERPGETLHTRPGKEGKKGKGGKEGGGGGYGPACAGL